MEWPDAAHDAFSGLPEIHRVAGFYVILAVGAVGVLMALRKWLGSEAAPPQAPPVPPINVQLIPFDQAVAAMRRELKEQINGSLVRLERSGEQRSEKIDRLDEKLDGHSERLALLEQRLVHIEERDRWDGRERRRQ